MEFLNPKMTSRIEMVGGEDSAVATLLKLSCRIFLRKVRRYKNNLLPKDR